MTTTIEGSTDDALTREFCAAIGELILWASMIDGQLNKVVIALLVLPRHVMIEPIVAQLDARVKAELLRKRAKLLTSLEWKPRIANWVKGAERTNAKRNVVAHHGIRFVDGKIILHSDQLGKIMDSLKPDGDALKRGKPYGLSDILTWIEEAKATHSEGSIVLENLEQLCEIALAKLAAKKAK